MSEYNLRKGRKTYNVDEEDSEELDSRQTPADDESAKNEEFSYFPYISELSTFPHFRYFWAEK